MDYNTKYKVFDDLNDLDNRCSKLFLYLGKKLLENEDDFNDIAKLQNLLSEIRLKIESNEFSKEPEVVKRK